MASEGGNKIWWLLAGAIGFGLVAALFSALYLKGREEAIRLRLEGEKQQSISVVVAQEDLPKGAQVGQSAFAVRPMPQTFVHADAVLPGDFETLKQRFLTVPLAAGKPLLHSFLSEDFPRDFSDTLPAGMRAITISVDDESSHAAMLRPGDFTDIFVNIPVREAGYMAKPPDLEKNAGTYLPPEWMQIKDRVHRLPPTDIVMPVVQDVKVLATGRDAYKLHLDELKLPQQRENHRYSTITLGVTAKQAALLRTAEDKGELLAFLRNRDDRTIAEFVGVTPQDLFGLAMTMAAEAQVFEAAAAAGAKIDKDGNWVMPDGTVINKDDVVVGPDGTVRTKSGKLLAAPGIKLNANGEFVDKDGKVIKPSDIAVPTPDGKFVDANGDPIAPGKLAVGADGTVKTQAQMLAEKGLSLNDKGQIVDKDGNIVDPASVVMQTPDGRFVDANGKEIPADQLVVGPDGKVKTKADVMAAAGFTKNANGDYVDAAGNVIPKDDVVVLANGTVMTKDGKVLAGPDVKVNEQGFIVAADGTVMDRNGKVLNGLRVNDKGEVVTPDGNKLDAKDLMVAADGTVKRADGTLIAGVTANTPAGAIVAARVPELNAVQEALADGGGGAYVDLIIGGTSQDGVAKVTTLPITE